MSNSEIPSNENINEPAANIEVEPESTDRPPYMDISEDVEQISKDVIVGCKEVRYEDGRNFISVIINAISVRINMPRGTVKALMACFAALILTATFYGLSLLPSNDAEDKTAEKGTAQVAEKSDEIVETAENDSDTYTPEGVLSLKDYVNISPHYYYHLPDNVEDIWDPDEYYAENETFCDFKNGDNYYTIRSYVLEYTDDELADIVKADLSLFECMEFLDEEYIDGKYGEILKMRFETKDDDGGFVAVTGYYWYESSPKICCLEVSSDAWYDEGAEDQMDKLTGEVCRDADGNEITAEQEFTAGASKGKISVTFIFDGSLMYGKDTVVFEKIYDSVGHIAAKHEDIDDEGQTVTWEQLKPAYEMYKIRTTKAPSKGKKYGFFAQDEIEYEVHVENTGNIDLTMDVTDQFTQNPEYFSLPVIRGVSFTGEGSWNNKGEDDYTANITLEPGEKAVVTYTAVVSDAAKEYLAAKANDSDSKDAKGSDTNKEYQKNETDDNDGYWNTAYCDNVTYINPENPDEPGTLEPKEDTAQTPVQKPEIGTTLTGDKKTKKVSPLKGTKLTDVIRYKAFDTRKWYIFEGTLIVKDTGDPLVEKGLPVTVRSEPFKPVKANGKAKITFVIDASDLKGKELVAFETAYRLDEYEKGGKINEDKKVIVAEHKDLEDKDQTISISETVKSAGPKTGDRSRLMLYLAVMLLAIAGLMPVAVREGIRSHKQRKEDIDMLI